jgi:hypothetical protein
MVSSAPRNSLLTACATGKGKPTALLALVPYKV